MCVRARACVRVSMCVYTCVYACVCVCGVGTRVYVCGARAHGCTCVCTCVRARVWAWRCGCGCAGTPATRRVQTHPPWISWKLNTEVLRGARGGGRAAAGVLLCEALTLTGGRAFSVRRRAWPPGARAPSPAPGSVRGVVLRGPPGADPAACRPLTVRRESRCRDGKHLLPPVGGLARSPSPSLSRAGARPPREAVSDFIHSQFSPRCWLTAGICGDPAAHGDRQVTAPLSKLPIHGRGEGNTAPPPPLKSLFQAQVGKHYRGRTHRALEPSVEEGRERGGSFRLDGGMAWEWWIRRLDGGMAWEGFEGWGVELGHEETYQPE